MVYSNILGQIRVGVRSGVVVPTITPLLDLYPGATASYSFRKLRSSYTGPAVKVRRSSDGLESDISFTASGDLDTNALLSFVGSNNIVTYSQQFDNNSSWSKTGVLITANGATAPDGTLTADVYVESGTGQHFITRNGSMTMPTDSSWNSSIYIKKGVNNTSNNNNIIISRDFSNMGGGYYGGDKAIFNLDTGNIVTRDISTLGLEGATMSSVGNGWFRLQMWGRTTASWTNNFIPISIARAYYDANGNLQNPTQGSFNARTDGEYYIWGAQFTYKTGDVTGKIAETYTEVVGGSGGSGWVTKWYDQSGNNKHLVQTTAVNQSPLVVSRVINTIGGKPSLKIKKTDIYVHSMSYAGSMILAGPVTMYSVARFDLTSIVRPAITLGNYTLLAASSMVGTSTFVQNYNYSNYVYTATNTGNTNRNLFFSLANGGSSVIGFNGANTSTLISGSIPTLGNTSGLYLNTYYGYFGNNYYYEGDIQEIVLYNTNNSVDRFNIDNNINSYYSIYTPTVDTDAQAFITAANITNSTQQTAVNKLVNTFKSFGLWSKMRAVYPFVGGTEFSHKFNLKDPRDLDAAYRLTFSGGMTHSSSGIVPNGINAYADTKLTPSIISSAYIGYYSSSNAKSVGGDQIDMGSITPSSGQIFISSWTDGSALGVKGAVARYSASGMLLYSNTVTDLRGFFSMNRVSGTIKFYQNTSLITSQFTGSSVLPNINLYLCALNNNGNTQMFSNRTMSMSIISDSLTDTDVTNLYNTVQQFQTDLGRQV